MRQAPAWVESRGYAGRLYREVVAVRLSARRVFLPDLCYFAEQQIPLLQQTFAPIAPAFVVGVLAPSTADNDVGPKFAAYEQHGVQEYWVLDPDHLAHRFYRRQKDLFVEYGRDEETIASEVVAGFRVRRAWLDPAAPPPVSAALQDVLADGR